MREGGCAFAQHAGAARRHRRTQHVALAGDPAWVGHHVHHVAGPRVESHLHGVRHACGVAAVHVHHALGLAGAAAGVDEEERVIGIQRHGRAGSPDGAHEIGVRQSHQRGFVGHVGRSKASGAGSGQQGGERCVGEIVAPAVALGAPHQVGLCGVAHHHHGVHARRRGHQRLGHRRAQARGCRRVQPPLAAEVTQRTAHAAHGVAALHRHFAGEGVVDGSQHLLRVVAAEVEFDGQRSQTQRDGLAHHRHRHVIVQRGVGVGGLERHDLRVAVATVCGDDHARTRVVNAVGQRLVAEAAEHRRVDHAQALGRLGPVELLGNVGQVQRNAVAGAHAQGLQCQRALGGFQQQPLARDGVGLHRRAAAVVL